MDADVTAALRKNIEAQTKLALLTVCARNWPIENCVVFCADIYLAAGFVDPIARYRSTYTTEAEAYARLGLFGVAGLHARVAKAMGWERIDVARAQDGDWGLGHTNAGPTSCIRYRGAWVNSRIGGFALLDARQMIAAWKVC